MSSMSSLTTNIPVSSKCGEEIKRMSLDIDLSTHVVDKRFNTITGNVDESPAKKIKGETEDSCVKEGGVNGSAAKCLTPEQKKRMAGNQMQARMKLLCKQLPALHSSIGETWFSALEPEFRKEYFKKLSNFVEKERSKYTIYPPEDKVWTWTSACEFNKVKVVILGQDPYHGPRQAHGLCFSVQPGVPPPPSLVNIFKELKNDIPGFEIPKHGYLIGWARQGVLLLNACLTVRASSANSHKDQGWENLTDAVIKALNEKSSGLVFLLWGAYAEKKSVYVDKKKHHILKTVHPSPLSASRGFFGCKHFSRANELLKSQGKTLINWNDLPVE